MNIFKALFGGKEVTTEEKKREEEARKFSVLKHDGLRAIQMRQFAYAAKCFLYALDINDDLECRDYYSQALIQTGDLAAAYEQLHILAEAQPENPQIFMRMAEVAYMMENYVAMSEACEKAMLIDDNNPYNYFLYARACRGQGDNKNAIAMITKAISLKEDFYDAILFRAQILLSSGEIEEAGNDAEILMNNVNGNEEILLLVARLQRAKGNNKQALEMYNRLEVEAPFCIDAICERAAVKSCMGDDAGAQADLKAAEELAPEYVSNEQNIEDYVRQKYRESDPYGIFGNM